MPSGPPSQPPPAPPPDSQLTAEIAAILAAGTGAAATVAALGATLGAAGLSYRAVRAAYRLLRYSRPPPPAGPGPAGRRTAATAATYRALYLLNAARRLHAGFAAGNPGPAARRETHYLRAHLAAQRGRADAARRADQAARASARAGAGAVFMWLYRSEPGAPCTPIRGRTCRQLHQTVWPVAAPPDGTWPGMRHYGCRCEAVPVGQAAVYRRSGDGGVRGSGDS